MVDKDAIDLTESQDVPVPTQPYPNTGGQADGVERGRGVGDEREGPSRASLVILDDDDDDHVPATRQKKQKNVEVVELVDDDDDDDVRISECPPGRVPRAYPRDARAVETDMIDLLDLSDSDQVSEYIRDMRLQSMHPPPASHFPFSFLLHPLCPPSFLCCGESTLVKLPAC